MDWTLRRDHHKKSEWWHVPLQTDFHKGNHSNVGTAFCNGHSSGRMLSAEAQYFCLQAVITCDCLKTVTSKELPLTRQKREWLWVIPLEMEELWGKEYYGKPALGFDESCRHKVSTDSGLPHASLQPTGTRCRCIHSAAVGPVLMQGASPDAIF